jgi:iron(III) transport system substrate-binding protein
MMLRRTFLQSTLSAVTLASSGLLATRTALAQSSPADMVEAAKREGKLTYYSSTNPVLSKQLVDKFNAAYPGITVDIVRLATGPLSQRYAAEMQAGTVIADILQMGDPIVLEDGFAKGWFADISGLPAVAAWPAAFKTAYSATVSIFPDTITYNTSKVKPGDVPKSWEDVLDPKWKNRILMADLRNVPQLISWAALMQDTFGANYLSRLREQNPKIVSSTVPGSQMLAAGEGFLLLPNLRMVSASLIEKGAPLDDVTPTPATGWGASLGISAKAPSPNAARLFTSFILSREGQEVLSKGVAASPLPDVPGALPLAADFHLADIRVAMRRAPEVLKAMGLE